MSRDDHYPVEVKLASTNGYFTPEQSNGYYKTRYERAGITVHWWGDGTGAGNHDNIVNYMNNQSAQGNKSVNYVLSDNKITLCVSPDNVAFASQTGNPTTISVETQPTLGDEGYKKWGWLVDQLQQRYGHRLPLYPHSHWWQTACPGSINLDRIRAEADKWERGEYDHHDAPAPTPPPVQAPPIVVPPPTPPAPLFTVTPIDPIKVKVAFGRNKWNLGYGTLKEVKANPITQADNNTEFTAVAKLSHAHIPNSVYYLEDANTPHGWNIVDCSPIPVPTPTPTPVKLPTAPLQAPSRDLYDLVVAIPGYKTATSAGNHTDSVGTLDPDKDWYVFNTYHNKEYLKNLTQVPGVPGFWVNTEDNTIKPPPAPEAPVDQTPVTTWHTPAVDPVPVDISWQDTYKSDPNRRHWIVEQAYTVKDLTGKGQDIPVKRGGEFTIYGYFTKDNTYYARPQRTPGEEYWYGIPILIAGLEAGVITDVYNTETTLEEKQVLHTLTYSHYLKLAILSLRHFFERLKDRVKNKQNKENT